MDAEITTEERLLLEERRAEIRRELRELNRSDPSTLHIDKTERREELLGELEDIEDQIGPDDYEDDDLE
jgi:hypothetical protein